MERKDLRLKGYDYSRAGAYFVTVCIKDREKILWDPAAPVGQGLGPCLSPAGIIVQKEIEALAGRFPGVTVDKYVVMEDHVHILLTFSGQGQSPCPTLGAVIGAFKSLTTKKINVMLSTPGRKIWQWRFHDHIIRDEQDYRARWAYIDTNPARWQEDRFYEV